MKHKEQFLKTVEAAIKYRKYITEIIQKINSEKTLKRIYKFVSYLYTHEADG